MKKHAACQHGWEKNRRIREGITAKQDGFNDSRDDDGRNEREGEIRYLKYNK